MKYQAPSSAPEKASEFQLWMLDELRHISDAMSEIETDTVLFKEWNAEPDKRYEGLVIFADGTNFDPNQGKGFYGYQDGAWRLLGIGGILRSIHLRFEPGATPGTNVNVTDRSDISLRGFNPPSITDATNLAKSTSSGSFDMDAVGKIDLNLTEVVTGIISSDVTIHDINNSSVTQMFTLDLPVVSDDIQMALVKRGTTVPQDWTAILQAGDTCEVQIAFVTST